MASEAQLRANRINAQRSTGPRTAAGKDRTRYNALKHGLTSLHIVLPTEENFTYVELRGELFKQYNPQNPSETFLVDQLAQNWWRLNRSRRYETGMLSKLDAENGAPTHADFDLLRRYEASIERAYYRAYDRLEKIARRRPEVVEPEEDDSIGSVSQNGVVPTPPTVVVPSTPRSSGAPVPDSDAKTQPIRITQHADRRSVSGTEAPGS